MPNTPASPGDAVGEKVLKIGVLVALREMPSGGEGEGGELAEKKIEEEGEKEGSLEPERCVEILGDRLGLEEVLGQRETLGEVEDE